MNSFAMLAKGVDQNIFTKKVTAALVGVLISEYPDVTFRADAVHLAIDKTDPIGWKIKLTISAQVNPLIKKETPPE